MFNTYKNMDCRKKRVEHLVAGLIEADKKYEIHQ